MPRLALLAIAALVLAGCSAPTPDDGRLKVVASTNVYGSIAALIGQDGVTVTSLIHTAAQDPHSFEASARDQLAVSKAELVIENGGGYDDFVDTLLDAAGSDAVVITAAEVVALPDGANEHLWYDLSAMSKVADEVVAQLSDLDPANAAVYDANGRDFVETLDGIRESVDGVADGEKVAITEPVPLYLLELAGFTNVTPDEFSEAIEEGTDVSPVVLKNTLAVIGDAALLAYNSQTASPETEQLRDAAEDAGVPVVEFTETLPDGEDYLSWMTANAAAL